MASDVDVREMLMLQLSEIEMIQSMFCNPGEFVLDDEAALDEIRTFLDGKIDYESLSLRLGFTLKLEDSNGKGQMEMVCQLPHEYPDVYPEVFIRAPMLSRSQHRSLSDALQAYITNNLEKGQLYLCSIIQWIQDNKDDYIASENEPSTGSLKDTSLKYTVFSRMWIYSHHIYNKFKRKAILEFSHELNLTGFCMPGKPGMICIEGYNENVEEFWHRIRRMQWKKIVMKEKEDTKLDVGQSVDDLRRFEGFEERSFDPRLGKGRDARANRGLLYQFLEERGCAHIFPLYYGVQGQAADDND